MKNKMKKADTFIAILIGAAVLGLCLLAWNDPQTFIPKKAPVSPHAHSCGEHDHSHDHEHGDSCSHDHAHGDSHSHDHAKNDSHGQAKEGSHSHSHDHEHGDSCSHGHAKEDAHSHSHDHAETEEIALSLNALQNIGLASKESVMELQLGSFTKTHSIPAIIMEFEGRTLSQVAAPYAGIVTKIYCEPGESVLSGEPLFDITLSLPEMLDAQIELVRLLETREFLESEIAEIDKNLQGLAPQRRREMDIRLKETKIEISSQRNVLRVLGLPEEVIERLEKERKPIIHLVTVKVPPISHHGILSAQNPGENECSVIFEVLKVNVGKSVEVGESLCDLCDLCELTVRGDAFAIDEGVLLDALRKADTPVRVTFDSKEKKPLENLKLRMVESKIDETNRTLSCFADFTNIQLKKLTEAETKALEASRSASSPNFVHAHTHAHADEHAHTDEQAHADEHAHTDEQVHADGQVNPNGSKIDEETPAHEESHTHTHGESGRTPRYIHWLHKPGHRCQMEIAYDTIPNVFVVPAGAVAKDVHETYVFELVEEVSNGEKVWRRCPVHLLFRTQEQAAIANDGSLKPGMRIAAGSASFILDAFNAQSGSSTKIDPHAGHNH